MSPWPGLAPFVVSLCLGLAGCGSSPSVGGGGDAAVARFAAAGYRVERRYEVEVTAATWYRDGEPLDLVVRMPSGAGPAPLVLYLPGLGESVQAGERWCEAWARAGYAVVTLQARRDAGLLSSAAARAGDFTALARQAFADEAVARRVAESRFVIAGIRERAMRGTPPFAQIDLKAIAFAGFDVGGDTALALAAQRAGEPEGTAPAASIVLSPRPGEAQTTRFGDLAGPLLRVTATGDDDPYGLIADPAMRQDGFARLPPGGKAQLVLDGGTHALLGGTENAARADASIEPRPRRPDPGRERTSADPSKPRDRLADTWSPDQRMGIARAPDARDRVLETVVEQVTTAFLDAMVRRHAAASTWLDAEAASWMTGRATLQRR